jgi:hypothetical protein
MIHPGRQWTDVEFYGVNLCRSLPINLRNDVKPGWPVYELSDNKIVLSLQLPRRLGF